MSVTSYIANIEASRNTIRTKLVEMGMAQSADKLDALAAAIEDIIDRGAVSVTVKEGDTYTIPKGYHNGSGTVSGVGGGGNYTLQSKTVTPTKKQQNITPDSGYFGLSDVTVGAIPDAFQNVSSVNAPKDAVLTGYIYVTADGTVTPGEMPNRGAVDMTLDVTTVAYTIPKGYHDGLGKVKLVLETKSVTPTKSVQEITPTNGKVLSKVTVEAIPAKYQDVSSVTAAGAQVLEGYKIVDASGNPVDGGIPNKGTVTATIDGLTTTDYTIPAGYHNGSGKVSLSNDIENALAAI